MLIPRSTSIPDDRLHLLTYVTNKRACSRTFVFFRFFSDPALDFYLISEKFPPFLFIDIFTWIVYLEPQSSELSICFIHKIKSFWKYR